MQRLLIASFAIGFGLGLPAVASAADLGRPAPAPVYSKAPPYAPPLSWTGCYLGGNVGGGWSSASYSNPSSGSSYGNANGSGFVGGGQVGCDYQWNSFVIGVQGMFDGTSINGSGTSAAGLANSDKIPWLATVTGRVGYTITPSALIYAKGGGAWVQNNLTATSGASSATADYTASGWTAGGGLEYIFAPHWSVFGEYDYIGLENTTQTLSNGVPVNTNQNVQMGLVGINYRF